MQESSEKCLGFDTTWRMRVPSDLVPRIHAYSRSRGLTSSAWIRMLICDALAESEGASRCKEAA